MNKRDLKGSPLRDAFKLWHKQQLPRSFYGCDVDYLVIEKSPPGIVAALDFKHPLDTISFTEVIAYNAWLRVGIPVYIVESEDLVKWTIKQYLGGNERPDPPEVWLQVVCCCWNKDAYQTWENGLRSQWRGK